MNTHWGSICNFGAFQENSNPFGQYPCFRRRTKTTCFPHIHGGKLKREKFKGASKNSSSCHCSSEETANFIGHPKGVLPIHFSPNALTPARILPEIHTAILVGVRCRLQIPTSCSGPQTPGFAEIQSATAPVGVHCFPECFSHPARALQHSSGELFY